MTATPASATLVAAPPAQAATVSAPPVAAGRDPGFAGRIAPLSAAMFLGFLSVSLPLPAVPLQVTGGLGFGTVVAGSAVGLQSFATVLTRAYAGRHVDERGAKQTLAKGLVFAALAELVLLVSALCAPDALGSFSPTSLSPASLSLVSLAVLLLGRLVLGVAESLLITGVLSWAIARAGDGRAGRAMSWNGMAQYGALALGAPAGFALYRACGFAVLVAIAAAAPLLALVVIAKLAPPPQEPARPRIPLLGIVRRIRLPGIALMLAGIGFSAIATFASLLFRSRDWPNPGLALLCYGVCFVVTRAVGGGWPDRFGAPRVAAASMLAGAAGQALLWLAPDPVVALCGAGLTGIGCSLVFPALGIEALKRVPEHGRGITIGAFAAFQDVAIGGTGPVLGLLAAWSNPSAVFLAGAAAALCGSLLAMRLAKPRPAA